MAKKKAGTRDISEKIIGRLKEQELLQDLVKSKKSEFIAVYGRCRIGKTYLIKNFMGSFPYVFFHVTGVQKGPVKAQLKEFAKQIGKNLLSKSIYYPSEKLG